MIWSANYFRKVLIISLRKFRYKDSRFDRSKARVNYQENMLPAKSVP